jgi:hypothetical protein
MISEQHLVEKWRRLLPNQQRQVLDFLDSLDHTPTVIKPRSPLGQQLRQIRSEIMASGVPLLSWEEVEQEKRDRRSEQSDGMR